MSAPGVVMVSASFHPHVGGAEKQALELSVALRARGVPVVVATRRLPGLKPYEEARGVPVHRLWRARGLDAPSFMLSLAWFLWKRRAEYGAIHVHLAGSPAIAAAAMGRLLDKRVIVKLGGGAGIGELATSSRTAFGRLKLRLLSALRPKLTAVAGELAEEARRFLGPVDVEVLPNGVDVQAYRPLDEAARKALRLKLGWPARGLVFLYTGRFSVEKRLPQFVEVWAEAARRATREARLVLVGAGPERRAIETAVAYAKAQDKVLLLPPTDAIAELYAAADVFVLPSISEGLSNALLEAMASGLTPLASRVGGTPEAVQDGVSGLLFAPTDEPALRAQLAKLFETPGLTIALGQAARQAAVERFSMDRLAERCLRLYMPSRE